MSPVFMRLPKGLKSGSISSKYSSNENPVRMANYSDGCNTLNRCRRTWRRRLANYTRPNSQSILALESERKHSVFLPQEPDRFSFGADVVDRAHFNTNEDLLRHSPSRLYLFA